MSDFQAPGITHRYYLPVASFGIIGYDHWGYNFLDATYMTVITVGSVGYESASTQQTWNGLYHHSHLLNIAVFTFSSH
jgi:hypothetical protein